MSYLSLSPAATASFYRCEVVSGTVNAPHQASYQRLVLLQLGGLLKLVFLLSQAFFCIFICLRYNSERSWFLFFG
jgi:hypothetical protein